MQRHRGWVSDEASRDVAELLDMTPDELDSIATFYNLIFRKPVGRHVILLCDSVSCWIMGYEQSCDASAASGWASAWARRPPTAASRCCPSSAWAPATTPRR